MAETDYYPLTQQLYIAYFGRPADPLGLKAFAAALASAKAPTTVAGLVQAYAGNPAVKALVDGIGSSNEAAVLYGAADAAGFVNAIFDNVLHRSPKPAGLDYWTAKLASGQMNRAEAAMNILAGAILSTSDPAQALLDRAMIGNRLAVATAFTTALDTPDGVLGYQGAYAAATARALLHDVTASTDPVVFQSRVAAAVFDMTHFTSGPVGFKYTLGSGVDTVLGSPGPDRIEAGYDAVSGTFALGATDKIDGGGGRDTLAVSDTKGGMAHLSPVTVKAVERLELVSAGALTGNAADLSGFADLVEARFDVNAGVQTITANADTTLTVTNRGGGVTAVGAKMLDATAADSAAPGNAVVAVDNTALTRVTIKGGSTVAITDASTDSNTLNLVALDHHRGAATLTGKALQYVSLADTTQDLTIVDATLYHQITIALNQVHGARIVDALAGNVRLNGWAIPSDALTLSLGRAAYLWVSAAVDLHFDAIDARGLVVLSLSGEGRVEIGAASKLDSLERINAAFSTGGVSLDVPLSMLRFFAGGQGDDRIVLGTSTCEVAGGAGKDLYILKGDALVTIADLGAGDAIQFADAGNYGATLGAKVTVAAGAPYVDYMNAAAAGPGGTLHWFEFGGNTYVVNDVSAAATFQQGVDQVIQLTGTPDLSASTQSADGLLTFVLA